MKAQEYLSQAYHIELQVQTKLMRLQAINSLASQVTVSYNRPAVICSRNTHAMDDTVLKIMEAEEALNRKIDELVDKKQEISDVIDLVQNDSLRLILEKRYLCFLPWHTIAKDMNLSYRYLLARHRKAIGVVQRILDEREGKIAG